MSFFLLPRVISVHGVPEGDAGRSSWRETVILHGRPFDKVKLSIGKVIVEAGESISCLGGGGGVEAEEMAAV